MQRNLHRRNPSPMQPPQSCLVYTSPALADAMVAAIGTTPGASWLEPSFGGGAFLEALRRFGVPKEKVHGIDLDQRASLDSHGLLLRGTEFLKWAAGCRQQFDCIVGNPPFIRGTELPLEIRSRIQSIALPNGESLSRRANLWAAFLASGLQLLKPEGNLAFVLPAAWEYADYASSLRNQICRCFRDVTVHRCAVPMFPSVHDGSVVLIAKHRGSYSCQAIRRFHRDPAQLINSLERMASPRMALIRKVSVDSPSENSITLDQLLQLEIGAVTGDAAYFLMSEDERKRRCLPKTACLPVLTRTRDMRQAIITTKVWNQLLIDDARVWLFRPSDADCKNKNVKGYLRKTERKGGCKRSAYKVKNRKPWHRVRLPASPDVFLTGQSSVGLWIAINQHPRLTATNTLYVARFREKRTIAEMAAWGLAMVSSGVYEQWKKVARNYPDGLQKLEPSDLKQLRIPRPNTSSGARREYESVIQLLFSGKGDEARARADAWLSRAT